MNQLSNINISGSLATGFDISISGLSLDELKNVMSYLRPDKGFDENSICQKPELKQRFAEIMDCFSNGSKLLGIKLWKDYSGMDLRSSKDDCDIIVAGYNGNFNQDWNVILLKSLNLISKEGQRFVLSGYSRADLHHYRGPINSSEFGI